MGSNYWSCTKFADWIRGTPKIHAGTEKEWRAWENIAKKKMVRYWLAEEGLDHLQKIINWPRKRLQDAPYYIDNRWISKTHALTSNLKKGQWYEFETQLLYSTFDSLIDFVEIELAWFHMACSDEVYKKYKTPWYRTILCFSTDRNPEEDAIIKFFLPKNFICQLDCFDFCMSNDELLCICLVMSNS